MRRSIVPAGYGVDMITFYHPGFWGMNTENEMFEWCSKNPELAWEKMLTSVQEAGITWLELTFGPSHWSSAVKVFGSAQGFRDELDNRGLKLWSGFHNASEWDENTDMGKEREAAIAHTEFIRDAGGDTIVIGPGMRRTRNTEPPLFIDYRYMHRLADELHAIGSTAAATGVKLAVHTEAHSCMSYRSDVDLLMTITDPAYVGLCPDSAHLSLAGSDPVEILKSHWERVMIAHWKDALGPMEMDIPIEPESIMDVHTAHRQYWCWYGEGCVDFIGWAEQIARGPSAGRALLELDAVPDPINAMKAAKEYMAKTLTTAGLPAGNAIRESRSPSK